MTVGDIKLMVMHQYNLDASDLQDYVPFLITYINEGYTRLTSAWADLPVGTERFPWLKSDNDVPNIPEVYHKAMVDWATWCLYRNGNSQKQQRGMYYRNAFMEVEDEIKSQGGEKCSPLADLNGDGFNDETGAAMMDDRYFFNIPR